MSCRVAPSGWNQESREKLDLDGVESSVKENRRKLLG